MTEHIKKFKNGLYTNVLKVKADRPDINDLKFKNAFRIDPTKWKKRTTNADNYHFEPFDQLTLGSCTANSLAKHFRYAHKLDHDVSRLFIYYLERAMEGSISIDSGAELRDGMKVLATFGAPAETLWPYNIDSFTKEPSCAVMKEAKKDLAHHYYRLLDVDDMKQVLNDGHIFSFGFTVYEMFESDQVAKDAFVPIPKLGEKAEGGHAVLAVDVGVASDWLNKEICDKYSISPTHEVFKVLNSWGPDWGDKGFCYMPIEYFKEPDLVSDVWSIFPD